MRFESTLEFFFYSFLQPSAAACSVLRVGASPEGLGGHLGFIQLPGRWRGEGEARMCGLKTHSRGRVPLVLGRDAFLSYLQERGDVDGLMSPPPFQMMWAPALDCPPPAAVIPAAEG